MLCVMREFKYQTLLQGGEEYAGQNGSLVEVYLLGERKPRLNRETHKTSAGLNVGERKLASST